MEPKTFRHGERTEYVFVAPAPARRLVQLLMVLALVGLGVGITLSLSGVAMGPLALVGVSFAAFLVAWAMLQASIPQRITVKGAHIQIRRDGKVHEYDLEDPNVDLRVKDGEIAFAHYQDRWVVVRSRDVDWKIFTDVVMYYQNKADHNAEERDRRFNR